MYATARIDAATLDWLLRMAESTAVIDLCQKIVLAVEKVV